jgi:hypothetical protein
MSQTDFYRQAITRYIAARQPTPKWPQDRTARYHQIGFVPYFVPDLDGMPKNCLPLLLIYPYWVALVGILTDLKVLTADVFPERNKVGNLCLYPSFDELFSSILGDCDPQDSGTDGAIMWAVNVIDQYRERVGQLRKYYPEIAPLLVDPPPISTELRKAYVIADGWAGVHIG